MEVEPEYNYTEEDIRNLLLNGTLDQLKDFLDFAPTGAIEIAKNIAVEETGTSDAGTTVVNSVSLQDVIDKLRGSISSIVEASDTAVKVATEVQTTATEKHDWYNEKIAELLNDASVLDSDIKDVSSDLHSIVKIQRDASNNPHPDVRAKKFVVLDLSNEEKIALVPDGSALKVTNDTTNDYAVPSNIFVNDVLLPSESGGKYSLNASIASFALSQDVSILKSQTGNIDSSLSNLYDKTNIYDYDISILKSRIDKNTSIINSFVSSEQDKSLEAKQLKLKDGVATTVLIPNGNGGLIVTNSFGGSQLGTIKVSDIVVSETTESGETDSIKNIISDVKSNNNTLDILSENFNELKTNFDNIYQKTGDTGRISTDSGNFTSLNVDKIKTGEYVLASGTTFEPRDFDGNIVNARFANVLLQPDIDNAGASISLYSKINELQTYQETYRALITDLNNNYTYGSNNDNELRLGYLTAKNQITSPKFLLNGNSVPTYIFTPTTEYMTINTFNGVTESRNAKIAVYDVALVSPDSTERIYVRDYLEKLGNITLENDEYVMNTGENLGKIIMTDVREVTALNSEFKVNDLYVNVSGNSVSLSQFMSTTSPEEQVKIKKYLKDLGGFNYNQYNNTNEFTADVSLDKFRFNNVTNIDAPKATFKSKDVQIDDISNGKKGSLFKLLQYGASQGWPILIN